MYRKTRAEGFGAEVKRRILVGTYVLSHGYYDAYYLKAQQVRRLIADDFRARVRAVRRDRGPDGAVGRVPDRRQDRRPGADVPQRHLHRSPPTSTGAPAMSIPCGFDRGGLPIGLQLQGNYFAEAQLLERRAPLPAGDRLARQSRAGRRRLKATVARPSGMKLGSRHRPRDARAAVDRVEDLLRRVDRVRRGAQHAGLRGRHRAARRAAGAEPRRRRARDPLRPRRRRDDQPRAASSRARTTSTPTCPRATRSASTRSRSSQGGALAIVTPRAARRPCG